MTPKHVHYLKLAALAATLWILYLVPWFPAPWAESLKPTIISVAFAVSAHRLRVASWPVVVAFALTFFVEGVTEVYVNSPALHETPQDSAPDNRALMLTLWSVIFSPISLWGPILFSTLVYGLVRGRRHDADPQ